MSNPYADENTDMNHDFIPPLENQHVFPIIERIASFDAPFDVSLMDHNDLITDAPYVNDQDGAYFILKHNDRFYGVICETRGDYDANRVFHPVDLGVLIVHNCETLEAAKNLVDLQFRIDTDSN